MIHLSVNALMAAAGKRPLLEGGAIIVGTFILEDAATVIAAMQVSDGKLGWHLALASLYLGIVLGDLGLYGLGRLAALFPPLLRFVHVNRRRRGQEWLKSRLFRVVFVSRFIPGARLPTYTACGFLGADFLRFATAAVVATSIWTSLLFLLSLRVGRFLMEHFGAWRWAGMIGFVILVVAAGRVAASIQKDVE